MSGWLLLLHTPRFRAFWLALLCNNMASWCVLATLPILVAERYGAGIELVASLGLRVLPKLVLAPFATRLVGRFGAVSVASAAMLAEAMLTAVLPWCGSLTQLQAVITLIGALDLFVVPNLLSLRAPVTPAGQEMACNTLCSVADRLAKILGPSLAGLAILAGFHLAFAGFAVIALVAAVAVSRLSLVAGATGERRDRMRVSGFLRLLRDDWQVLGLLVAAVTYMVLIGGLRPFLFWANRDWYGASDSAWTGLLVAQGVGALVGAVVSAIMAPRLMRVMSAYTLCMITGVMEGLLHLALLLTSTTAQAIVILALAGIPEIISTAAWFTALQSRLPPVRQGAFFTYSAPLWDVFFALGIASAGLHAAGWLSLSGYWALVSLSATLPLLPMLLVRDDA
jgi:hypothetical protein